MFWVLNQVIYWKILSNLTNYWLSGVVALPVMRIVVAIEQFDCFFSVVFPTHEADEKFLQIGVFDSTVNQLLNLTDWELIVDKFLKLVFVPVLAECLRKDILLIAELKEYVGVVGIHLGVGLFEWEVSVKQGDLEFIKKERRKVYVPMSMTVHSSLHEKPWHLQLFIHHDTYFFLLQYVDTKLTQNYLFPSWLFS